MQPIPSNYFQLLNQYLMLQSVMNCGVPNDPVQHQMFPNRPIPFWSNQIDPSFQLYGPLTKKIEVEQVKKETKTTPTEISTSWATHGNKNSEILKKNSKATPKNKPIKKSPSKKTEYKPYGREKSSNKSRTVHLDEFRNVLPNTIHQILSYVQRKSKSGRIVEKLITKELSLKSKAKFEKQDSHGSEPLHLMNSSTQQPPASEISLSRFYLYQSQVKQQVSNYVNLKTFEILCGNGHLDFKSEIFPVEEQVIYKKICRCAISYYLKEQVICILMASKRMDKDKRREHLRVNRKIDSYISADFVEVEI